jgi:hypothetical protein
MEPFLHPYLLGGLLLAGIPVLVHLVMRQKPKTLRFPAFRFLRQRHQSNRRKLRLQHLLLLALRVLLIAGLCLALARPRLSGGSWAFSGDRPVAAVFVLDTSPSMEYSAGGIARLDEARQRAREVLEEMADGSRVAVLDTADEVGGEADWLSPAAALSRLGGLRVRPANGTLNRPVEQGLRWLEQLGEGEEVPPRFLYVFSDRARACWDSRGPKVRKPEGVTALFVDVGAESPKDLAIDKVEVEPPVVPPGGRLQVRVTARATGSDFDTELTCRIDNDPEAERGPQRLPLQLAAGQSKVVVFEREAPARPAGGPVDVPYQVTVRAGTADALPFNNVRQATFLVRERRKVLTLVGPPPAEGVPPWRGWQVALDVVGVFECDVRPAADVGRLTDKELRGFAAVCVFEVLPEKGVWARLAEYVRQGGGLVLVPGGEDWLPLTGRFNEEAREVLPAALKTLVKVPADGQAVRWADFSPQHPITGFFRDSLVRGTPDYGTPAGWPSVVAYWAAEAEKGRGVTLASFADERHGIALAERALDRGHVLEFTTPLDFRNLDRRRWHNYWESSFGVVLVDQVCRYLAGDAVKPELNFLCGQPVVLTLPPPAASPPYTLQGPGLVLAEANLKAPGADGRLSVPQAVTPGNYSVLDGPGRVAGAFSLNVRAEESYLERVPAEEIEETLGPGAVLQVGRSAGLKEALQGLRPPPVELLPWLLMAVLLALALESLFANKFYRRAEQGPEPERTPT